MKKYRLAIVMSHPIHYLVDLYKELNRHPDVEVMVYLCSDFSLKNALDTTFGRVVKWYDKDILEGLPHVFLKNYSPSATVGNTTLTSLVSVINPGIIRKLAQHHYDAVLIHGYVHLTSWLAIAGALWTGTPIIMKGDACLLGSRGFLTKTLKKIVLSLLFKRVGAFLGLSSTNGEYYKFYGAPPEKIFFTPYAVNNNYFQTQHQAFVGQQQELREREGMKPDAVTILYAAKLIERKRPMDLLRAYEFLRKKVQGAQLLFVGDGPDRKLLEKHVTQTGVPDVYFAGFRNQSELPRFFALADMFVLPSEIEVFGLAINEAMNFCLPIITNNMVGASYDLVRHGENGLIYPMGNVATLSDYLLRLVQNQDLRKKMGKKSIEIINEWSFERAIHGILQALRCIVGRDIIVAQAGSHHLSQTARVLQETGRLKYYATTIYYAPNTFPYTMLRLLSSRVRSRIELLLRKRNSPSLIASRIKTFGFFEWTHLICNRIFRSSQFSRLLIAIRNSYFSLRVGELAKREAKILWCGLDSAREAFGKAKSRGVTCILDQFIGHPEELNTMLEQEIKLHPELKRVNKQGVSKMKMRRLRKEIAFADIVVAGSEFVQQTLLDHGVQKQKISVIPYGVNLTAFTPCEHKEKSAVFNMLFVGNVSVRKGCHYLLEAMRAITHKNIKLTMVGQMESNYFLKHCGSNCTWIRQVAYEKMPSLYRHADAYIFPSLFEGSSLSIYEALASGLPVITTPNSGSVVRDGIEGFIIPIRDIHAMRERIMRLYHNKHLRIEMGKHARLRAEEYSWETYQKNVAALVQNVASLTYASF